MKDIKIIEEYLKDKIYRWYHNVFEEYGVNGKFLKIDYEDEKDKIIIYHEEDNIKYKTEIVYISQLSLYQLYSIWMEENYEKI